MKRVDQHIKDAMAQKVVGRTTEISKAVVLELYQRITANSLPIGIQHGSPVLTGRYYASHTIARGRIDTTVREPNPDGEENPYPGLPLTNAAAALFGVPGTSAGKCTVKGHVCLAYRTFYCKNRSLESLSLLS
jgi:hypothetical protein